MAHYIILRNGPAWFSNLNKVVTLTLPPKITLVISELLYTIYLQNYLFLANKSNCCHFDYGLANVHFSELKNSNESTIIYKHA